MRILIFMGYNMRARPTPPAPMFNATVAEAAQDLLDRERLPRHLVAAGSPSDVGRRRVARSIRDWSASMEDCRAKMVTLGDAMTDVLEDPRSTMASVRLGLLDVEECISALLDRHLAAIWMSMPFDARVRRIRVLLTHLGGFMSTSDRAETYEDYQTATEGWTRVHDLLEERARLDPEAAVAAGYDTLKHDVSPLRWGDGSNPGMNLGL